MSSSRAEKIRQPEVLSTEGDVNASRRILKVNVAPGDVADVLKNTAARHTHGNKSQLDLITDGAHESRINNPHQVTKVQVGLGNVPNTDFTSDIEANTTHRNRTDNPHQVTKSDIGLGNVEDGAEQNVQSDWNETDIYSDAFIQNKPDVITSAERTKLAGIETGATNYPGSGEQAFLDADKAKLEGIETGAEVNVQSDWNETNTGSDAYIQNKPAVITSAERNALNANITHRNTTSGNPHNVTKAEVGLGNVPNTNFTDDINANTAHREIVLGNPHQVTKFDVGLGNVQDGAEQNVQSDWNETDTGSDAFIQNKPDVITSAEREAITANTTHRSQTDNPHQVTKAQIGLGDVPDTDFTDAVNANTAHRNITTGNPHQVTKAEIGLGEVENGAQINVQSDWDITNTSSDAFIKNKPDVITTSERSAIVANTTHRNKTDNPHQVSKAQVGLGNVPNIDFTNDIETNTTHRNTTSGNPHNVTKVDVNLGNVPNLDCTNAANITTGLLPSSVLPPIAITDVYSVSTEAAQLALVVQKGDVCVRTDLNKSYIAQNATNESMSDWLELSTPTDSVLSVNSKTGSVILTQDDVLSGSIYVQTHNDFTSTEKTKLAGIETGAEVNNISDANATELTGGGETALHDHDGIVENTAHRNTTTGNPHQVTKAQIGLGDVPNTDFTSLVNANTTHRNTTSGNPHQVTKADIGLGNVPNTDFTSDVNANTAHKNTTTGNPHQVTKAQVGLGEVPNTDFTDAVNANTAHRNITLGNPHQVTKADIGLGNVENGAEINVQSDWDETNTGSDAYIQNKPNVITSAERTKLEGIEIGAEKNVQSNWNETTVSSDAYIKNKPDVITNAERNAISANTTHRETTTGNPHQVTKAQISLGNVPNIDFTSLVNANTTHREITSGNPHNVTKVEIGLGNVPNTDFTDVVNANTAHKNITTGNPHQVTKSDIGLGSVQDGAQVNVQSDWNETDTGSDAYIQNKPDLSGIGEPNVQSDWNEDDTDSDAYIQNKPVTIFESFFRKTEDDDIRITEEGYIRANDLTVFNDVKVTELQDINSAGSGNIITQTERDSIVANSLKLATIILNTNFHTNWVNITDKAPSGDVLYQEFHRVYSEIDDSVSNEPYSSNWEGLTSQAPSKDALYAKFESLTGGGGYMDYPGAGIAKSNGTAWDTSLGLDTTTLSNNSHLATVQAIIAYGNANWGGGSGGGLWSDLTSYYKPNNTDTFGLYDTGQIRLNNNGNQTLPGTEDIYNPYCLGYSDSLNIYDDTTTRGTAGLVAQKKVTTHLTQSDGSPYSNTKSDTQPGAALFLTHHTTNNVSGIYNVVTGNVNTLGGVYGNMPDSIGIHNRVIKFSDTKNNAFGEWNFIERKPCTDVPQGGIAGAETNLLNTWCSSDSNRNKVYRSGVNSTHVYMQEFKYPVDNMYFGNSAIGWTISGIDSNGGTYGMMEAAIHIAPMQLTAVPAWANGILFSKHDYSPSDYYGPISPVIGTCINMVSALPKWGLKFGNVGAGGAHLYSTGDTIIQTGNGAKVFTLRSDGILEVPSVIRCTGASGGVNHGTVMSLVNDTTNQLAFGWEHPYLTIYFNGTKVRKINTLTL